MVGLGEDGESVLVRVVRFIISFLRMGRFDFVFYLFIWKYGWRVDLYFFIAVDVVFLI